MRSTFLNQAGTGGAQLTYVPYAFDNLGFAVTTSSNLPKNLTKAELISIYNCDVPGVKALLPQTGSESRASWLAYLGYDEAHVTSRTHHPTTNPAGCIRDTVGGTPIAVDNGVVLDADSIVPYTAGEWLLQSTNSIPDVHGSSVLGTIDGGLAAVPSPDFDGKRPVYTVIPTAQEGTAPYSTVFVGATSAICTNTSAITNRGFAAHPDCGSVALRTAP